MLNKNRFSVTHYPKAARISGPDDSGMPSFVLIDHDDLPFLINQLTDYLDAVIQNREAQSILTEYATSDTWM